MVRVGRVARVALGGLAIVIAVPMVIGAGALVWISALDRTNGSIVSSGEERRFLLHVPDGHDGAEPAALVVSLHAGATWPAHQENLTGWSALADEEGFLVVYPGGSDLPGLPGASRIAAKMWQTFQPGAGLERDVRFIHELLDTLGARNSIDPDRIYVTGMSNGGGMAYVLSCALSDRVAAVGIVAGAQALPPDWCAGAGPVPAILFHGTADPIAPYDGGPLGDRFNPVKPVLPAVEEWVESWAKRNGCMERLRDTVIAGDVSRVQYGDCGGNADVVLYRVHGGGHSWPGGKAPPEWRVGRTSQGVDATREMWAFFLDHPRRSH